jgi:succinate dehydrogenase/fumarate reductase flavoprotein subunit
MERRHLDTDVLVIGNGGAGLRAAVEAAEQGRRVVLASKIGADRPNSTAVIAGWGAHVPTDQVEDYFHMVVAEGNYLSDQELAWQYAVEAAERMPELQRFGVEMRLDASTLERPGTTRHLWFFPGPRGRLGDAIRTPLRAAAADKGVVILDNTSVTRLLMSDAAVAGATALDLTTGDLIVTSAKAVIIASGGASGIYARQNNPAGTTGDGYALAYRAGAELIDMEFDTFMMSHEELNALFSGALTEEEALSTYGAHYSCGGIKVDEHRRSSIPGLYAAGEAAGGTFGSARLGGSAVGDIIVSGFLAGRSAAEAAAGRSEPDSCEDQVLEEVEKLSSILSREGNPAREVTAEIRDLMWRKVGPVRRRGTLAGGIPELERLRGKIAGISAADPRELREAVEAELMLDVGLVIATAALERDESRGNHWRLDHPEPDNERWLRNLVVKRQSDGSPSIRAKEVALARISELGECRIGSAWTGGYVEPTL